MEWKSTELKETIMYGIKIWENIPDVFPNLWVSRTDDIPDDISGI